MLQVNPATCNFLASMPLLLRWVFAPQPGFITRIIKVGVVLVGSVFGVAVVEVGLPDRQDFRQDRQEVLNQFRIEMLPRLGS